ncbi:MAG: hypothetical protein ACLSHO_14405 [Dysosmobacter sp.]
MTTECLTVAYENAALNGIGKDRYAVLVGMFSPTAPSGKLWAAATMWWLPTL